MKIVNCKLEIATAVIFVCALFPAAASAAARLQMPPNYLKINTGLVGYWTMDGTNTNWGTNKTNDLSGQGNHGTMTNMSTTTSPVPGKFGQGLSFDGSNDYVDLPTINNSIRNNNTGAITAWIKIDTYTQYPMIFSHGDTDTTNYLHFNIAGDTDKLRIYWRMGADQSVFDGGTPISTGFWYHVAVTTNGSTYRLYVNGNEENLTTVSGSNTGRWFDDLGDSYPNAIGMILSTTPAAFFDGILDDVRVYNRALSASEISFLYQSGAAKFNKSPTSFLTSGLVGYWTMDGTNTNWGTNKTNDLSGQGNHGTMTNMSTTTSPVPGKIGQGLNFDGVDDRVDLGSGSSLKITGAMTVSAWVYLNAIGSGSFVNPSVVSKKGADGNRGWAFQVEGAISRPNFDVFVDGTGAGGSAEASYTASNLTGRWIHFVGTYEPSVAVRIYENGELKNSDTTSVPASQFDSTLNPLIGARPDLCSDCFTNGKVDDVRIYNRALSADEVYQLYNIGR